MYDGQEFKQEKEMKQEILPVKTGLLIFIHPSSYKGEIAASRVPNSESMPSKMSMIKNIMDQNGDASISSKASLNVINARPGPDPSWKQ